MSVVEGVVCIGFTRWAWKRFTHVGSDDSATWPEATADEFEPVPRICRAILAVYKPNLWNSKLPPSIGSFDLNPDWVLKRVTYDETQGRSPPYIIYVDHTHREIVLAMRGLNLANESDYKILLDNRLGQQMFDGGYVHHGLLKSAFWVLNQESETLRRVWEENGKEYRMVFAGHSLGSGVAALMTVVAVNNTDMLGGIPRSKIRCYAVAPARCMSLNLAIKYADVMHSVVLQDDFLPRTATPLEDIFRSLFCLPWFLSLVCLRDTFTPEDRKLRDPRRLYAPGRIYHIVERKFCRCGRIPPEVRTAIPVDGRFEQIVLSCNATSDHAILWIATETEKALQRLKEQNAETVTTPPQVKRMERSQTIEREHRDALERAVSLRIPHAVHSAAEEPPPHDNREAEPSASGNNNSGRDSGREETPESTKPKSKTNWDEVVGELFERSNTGDAQR